MLQRGFPPCDLWDVRGICTRVLAFVVMSCFDFTPSCAKVSPSPVSLLPSGSDGSVCVWVKSDSEGEELTARSFGEDSIEDNQETWTVHTTLRCEGTRCGTHSAQAPLHYLCGCICHSCCVRSHATCVLCCDRTVCLALSQGSSGGYL